jgi:hypothetical protein
VDREHTDIDASSVRVAAEEHPVLVGVVELAWAVAFLLFPLPCHLPKQNSVRQMGPLSFLPGGGRLAWEAAQIGSLQEPRADLGADERGRDFSLFESESGDSNRCTECRVVRSRALVSH